MEAEEFVIVLVRFVVIAFFATYLTDVVTGLTQADTALTQVGKVLETSSGLQNLSSGLITVDELNSSFTNIHMALIMIHAAMHYATIGLGNMNAGLGAVAHGVWLIDNVLQQQEFGLLEGLVLHRKEAIEGLEVIRFAVSTKIPSGAKLFFFGVRGVLSTTGGIDAGLQTLQVGVKILHAVLDRVS